MTFGKGALVIFQVTNHGLVTTTQQVKLLQACPKVGANRCQGANVVLCFITVDSFLDFHSLQAYLSPSISLVSNHL